MEIDQIAQVKTAFEKAKAEGDVAALLLVSRKWLRLSPTVGTAAQVLKATPVNLPNRAGITVKLAILRSFTIEPAIPLLKALARLHGIDLQVKIGEFNSYAQEIIDPSSWLYDFDPQIVILATQTRDVTPDVWLRAPSIERSFAISAAEAAVAPITTLIEPLRNRSGASLIIQSFETPLFDSDGLLGNRRDVGQLEFIGMMNERLIRTAAENRDVYVLDYDHLVSRHGKERWQDESKWLTSRAPIASDCLISFAEEYMRFLLPLCGRISKVLAVDLDNTLWGGVVGEDGVNGVKIGAEYPGAAFLELQRAILDLHERGILLAICSKNNRADALDVFDKRPEMLLKPSHFAVMRINWIDKAQNIKSIAAELNVGVDSIAFIDDNPAERERVSQAIPEAYIVDLPSDPMDYARSLRDSPVFERLAITAEDRVRGRYYAEQRERQQLESSSGSLEDFYRSLEMRAEFVGVIPETVARIAQMTQKTNQLNMTTRRYTESQIQEMSDSLAWRLFGIKIVDKFGDNGLVGEVFLKIDGQQAMIDTFLLSCRVIGRTVETAMLAKAREIALSEGCVKLSGWFLPTRKNMPAAKIYADHGFSVSLENEDGALWETDIVNNVISKPEWIGRG